MFDFLKQYQGDCCSILFTNFTPENILALLLTRLNQNILALLSGHLLAVLLRHVKAHLNNKILQLKRHSLALPLSEHFYRLLSGRFWELQCRFVLVPFYTPYPGPEHKTQLVFCWTSPASIHTLPDLKSEEGQCGKCRNSFFFQLDDFSQSKKRFKIFEE